MTAMVASEHPLVSQTGIDILRGGGNAFDAALAMSAMLPVVKPPRSHLGGDAYVLVYPKAEGRPAAICSGGKAPAGATLDRYRDEIPRHGGDAAAIPGLVDAWQVIADRWGGMPLRDLLEPAVKSARDGFPISRELELVLKASRGLFSKYTGLSRMFADGGDAPALGRILHQPALASTLTAIAEGGRHAFYTGPIAEQVAAGVQAAGGSMTAGDLAAHSADVLEPLSTDYRGNTVFETPPNSQGLILLEELNILEGFELAGWGHLSPETAHHQIEAKKLAFEDRQRFAGDPAFVDFDPQRLLTKEHAAERRTMIDAQRARPSLVPAASTDTTAFVVADADGNACSFIQSLYAAWGSAVGIPEVGVIMNNRMTGFSLEVGHPNVLAPGKRTMHTLNAYMVFRDGKPLMIGNTPGGDFQVQTNLQVITSVLDFGLDPQAAIDAPRWGDTPEALILEDDMPEQTQRELALRGHNIRTMNRQGAPMGRAQAIVIDPDSGAYIGGSDSRGEGAAAGW
jgi:gamma-glutamyltranspeptidase/glutathione hydrolase